MTTNEKESMLMNANKKRYMSKEASVKTGGTPQIKGLIWLYFFLLIFEGALRKWGIPSLNQPLVLVRTPVVLLLYFLAWRARLMPGNIFIKSMLCLALLSFLVSFFVPNNHLMITLYGLHQNFLYLPLIFVIPAALSPKDVNNIGKWVLLLSILMAAIMVMQFQSSQDSFWNRGVEGGYDQLRSSLGKGRPPGTFSFSTGPALFFPLVLSFLIHGIVEKKVYNIFLVSVAGISFLIAAAVSGNRSLVVGSAIVLATALGSVSVKPQYFRRIFLLFVVGAILCAVAFSTAIFKEGSEVLTTRFEEGKGVKEGLVDRMGGFFQEAYEQIENTPMLGSGIGTGTSVGSYVLAGERGTLWIENEWMRCLMESGLLLGLFYVFLRIVLVWFLFVESFKSLRAMNMLPMLLFGACAPTVLMGQFGQPNILGFAVLGAGLCLAARSPAPKEEPA